MGSTTGGIVGPAVSAEAFLVSPLFHRVTLLPVAETPMFSQPTEASLRWDPALAAEKEGPSPNGIEEGHTYRARAHASHCLSPNWEQALELWHHLPVS